MENQALARIAQAYQRGEYGRVIFICDQLLDNPAYKSLRPTLLYRKGQAHEALGIAWHGTALSCYREAYAEAGQDRPLKAKLIVELGKIHCLTGDWRTYEPYVNDFERLARSKDPEVVRWGPHVWYNFACGLDIAGEWEQSASAFSKAVGLARDLNNTFVEGLSLHNLGGVQLTMGNLPAVETAMSAVEALISHEEHGHKQTSRRAEYYLAVGDLANSQSMITAALTHPKVDDMTRADVYYTWAQVLVALGRPDEAQEKGMRALDFAVRAVHYPGIHKTNRLLRTLIQPSQ